MFRSQESGEAIQNAILLSQDVNHIHALRYSLNYPTVFPSHTFTPIKARQPIAMMRTLVLTDNAANTTDFHTETKLIKFKNFLNI
jgi:hypothetical protein